MTDVRSSSSLDPEVEQFKTAEKRLSSSTFHTGVPVVDILEKPEKVLTFSSAAVKPGKDTDTATRKDRLKRFDLLELFGANDGRFAKLVARFSDLSKLIRVMAYIMRVVLAKRHLGEPSAVGRSKVDMEITAKDYNDACCNHPP